MEVRRGDRYLDPADLLVFGTQSPRPPLVEFLPGGGCGLGRIPGSASSRSSTPCRLSKPDPSAAVGNIPDAMRLDTSISGDGPAT